MIGIDLRIYGRLMSYVRIPHIYGCWTWIGGLNQGYGMMTMNTPNGRKNVYVHRVIWEYENGERIPPGMQIDHLCGNRACVNPSHLECVTQAENLRRQSEPYGFRLGPEWHEVQKRLYG